MKLAILFVAMLAIQPAFAEEKSKEASTEVTIDAAKQPSKADREPTSAQTAIRVIGDRLPALGGIVRIEDAKYGIVCYVVNESGDGGPAITCVKVR